MTKTALITGITGQDGSYLAEFLLEKNYKIYGFKKKLYTPTTNQIQYIVGNLTNPNSIKKAIKIAQPDEVYNLASQSHPSESWTYPIETVQVNGLGAHMLFDAIKELKPDCRIYQASSSDMFGEILQSPQDEQTPFNPTNPYSAAKLYAHNIAKIYRQSYGMHISCGILFNHESPRRDLHFITQKVTYAAACLKLGINTSEKLNEKGDPIIKNGILSVGNLDAKRDWGYAGDYVEAMWLMLQQAKPDDYIIGTGQTKSISELCDTAFSYVNLDWRHHVSVDQRLSRPIETNPTIANPNKAKKILGWQAKKSFEVMIKEMIDCHLINLQSKGN